MNTLIDLVTNAVRGFMFDLAKLLNKMSGGAITPNGITWFGFAMHIPIALFIGQDKHVLAAVLLVVFGLFDALDGAMAKVQKKAGNAGMLLDATTDRMKEVILYIGSAYYFLNANHRPLHNFAVWAVAACGASLCVSYVKAKGETAVKNVHLTPNEINRLFGDGFARFQVRMLILIIGLLSHRLEFAVVFIALLSTLTALSRLMSITRKLS